MYLILSIQYLKSANWKNTHAVQQSKLVPLGGFKVDVVQLFGLDLRLLASSPPATALLAAVLLDKK